MKKQKRTYVQDSLQGFLNESQSKSMVVKRKYGDRGQVTAGNVAPLRDRVLNFVKESLRVSKTDLKKFIISLSEGKASNVSATMWLKRNAQFFIAESKNGETFLKLSDIGKRLSNRLPSNKMLESEEGGCGCGTSGGRNTEDLTEGYYRNPEDVEEYPVREPMRKRYEDIESDEELAMRRKVERTYNKFKEDELEDEDFDLEESLKPVNERADDFDAELPEFDEEGANNYDFEDEDKDFDKELDFRHKSIEDFDDEFNDDEEKEEDFDEFKEEDLDDEDEEFNDFDELEDEHEEIENERAFSRHSSFERGDIDNEIGNDLNVEPASHSRNSGRYPYDFMDKGRSGIYDMTEDESGDYENELKESRILDLINKIKREELNEEDAQMISEKDDIDFEGPEIPDDGDDDLNISDDDLSAPDENQEGDDLNIDENPEEGEDDKVEISEFVITVDDVDEAIKELEELGVNAERVPKEHEGSEGDEQSEEIGEPEEITESEDTEEELETPEEETEEHEGEEGEELENDEEYEEDEIKVQAADWPKLKSWLESKGYDPTELFGENEVEIEGGDVPEGSDDDINFDELDIKDDEKVEPGEDDETEEEKEE